MVCSEGVWQGAEAEEIYGERCWLCGGWQGLWRGNAEEAGWYVGRYGGVTEQDKLSFWFFKIEVALP